MARKNNSVRESWELAKTLMGVFNSRSSEEITKAQARSFLSNSSNLVRDYVKSGGSYRDKVGVQIIADLTGFAKKAKNSLDARTVTYNPEVSSVEIAGGACAGVKRGVDITVMKRVKELKEEFNLEFGEIVQASLDLQELFGEE